MGVLLVEMPRGAGRCWLDHEETVPPQIPGDAVLTWEDQETPDYPVLFRLTPSTREQRAPSAWAFPFFPRVSSGLPTGASQVPSLFGLRVLFPTREKQLSGPLPTLTSLWKNGAGASKAEMVEHVQGSCAQGRGHPGRVSLGTRRDGLHTLPGQEK